MCVCVCVTDCYFIVNVLDLIIAENCDCYLILFRTYTGIRSVESYVMIHVMMS